MDDRKKTALLIKLDDLLKFACDVSHPTIRQMELIKNAASLKNQVCIAQSNTQLDKLYERYDILERNIKIDNSYLKIDNSYLISETEDLARIDMLEKQIKRLMDRPRYFEKRAEYKLQKIDNKFNDLINYIKENSNDSDASSNDTNTSSSDSDASSNDTDTSSSDSDTSSNDNDASTSFSDIVADITKKTKVLNESLLSNQALLNKNSTVLLAEKYSDAKKSYCWNYRELGNTHKGLYYYLYYIPYLIAYIFKNIFQKSLFIYLFFLGSLAALGYFQYESINDKGFEYKYLTLTLPLVWSAWFFQRKINIREKIHEIYHHKQRVMETYVAFKSGSYNFNAEDKMEEVLLEAIKKDPSDYIGKDNTTIVESILDKLKGLFVAGKLKKAIKNSEDIL